MPTDLLARLEDWKTRFGAPDVHQLHQLPVSYTHLDVYKRQSSCSCPETMWKSMRARAKALAISGTQQTEQFASHSAVSAVS